MNATPRTLNSNDGLSQSIHQNKAIDDWADNRNSSRKKVIAGIQCSFFNTEKRHHGIIRNLSSDGMYFESSAAFPVGSNIFFTLTEIAAYESDPESRIHLRNQSLAQVVWCQPVEDQHGLYGIGVKYHKTIY